MGKNYVKTESHDLFIKSQCRGSWLHRYKIIKLYPTGIQERCAICGDIQNFRIIDGRTSNLDYISSHMREALPKNHPLFKHEFPTKI